MHNHQHEMQEQNKRSPRTTAATKPNVDGFVTETYHTAVGFDKRYQELLSTRSCTKRQQLNKLGPLSLQVGDHNIDPLLNARNLGLL